MGGDVPKQFLPIGGKPVLMHTLEAFHRFDPTMLLILVLPHDHQAYWRELCQEYTFTLPHQIADGGATRFHSVQNGLALIPADAQGVVGVHDGVRPFVSQEVLARCYQTAWTSDAVVPVTPVIETLRHTKDMPSVTVPRDEYRLVQTPQTFQITLLKEAYQQPADARFTDDASVVEALGRTITLVEGNRENIKLTTPFDILVAEALLAQQGVRP